MEYLLNITQATENELLTFSANNRGFYHYVIYVTQLYLMKGEKFSFWRELGRYFTLLLNDMVVLLLFYIKLNDANRLAETELIL